LEEARLEGLRQKEEFERHQVELLRQQQESFKQQQEELVRQQQEQMLLQQQMQTVVTSSRDGDSEQIIIDEERINDLVDRIKELEGKRNVCY
jgi:hypothetical protein